MPKQTYKCPNCGEPNSAEQVETQIDFNSVVLYDMNEFEVICANCTRPFYVEVKAEPVIKVKE